MRLLGPQQRHITHAVGCHEAVHALIEHAMIALRGVPQEQRAGLVEGDEAHMEIVKIRLPAHKPNDIAAFQFVLVRQKHRAWNDTHHKSTRTEPFLRIDGLFDFDRTIHVDPAADLVLNVVLAPFEEIMIALGPSDDAIVIADRAQDRIELLPICGNGGGKYGFAKRDTIESVVAHHKLFRARWTPDQRISLVARAAQGPGNKVEAL